MENIKTLLNTIRDDIQNGYDYFEYEQQLQNGWSRKYILNRKPSSQFLHGEILFYYENEDSYFSGIKPIDEFLEMSNSEFIKYLAEFSYYNTIEKDIECAE